LATLDVTVILYESPHRLIKCLEEIKEYLGDNRMVCVAREISKKFEEFNTLPVGDSILYYKNHPPKGEIVIVVEGQKNTKANKKQDDDRV
jgi:16S rRNA (cytidine1402-2'-O)-methyltransferase